MHYHAPHNTTGPGNGRVPGLGWIWIVLETLRALKSTPWKFSALPNPLFCVYASSPRVSGLRGCCWE